MLEARRRGESWEKIAERHERTPKAIEWRWGSYCQRRIRGKKAMLPDLAREFHVDPNHLEELLAQLNDQQQPSASSANGVSSSVIDLKKEIAMILSRLEQMDERLTRILRMLKKKTVDGSLKI